MPLGQTEHMFENRSKSIADPLGFGPLSDIVMLPINFKTNSSLLIHNIKSYKKSQEPYLLNFAYFAMFS